MVWLLAVEWTGKYLVAIGAFMAGAGAVMSGIAALRSARTPKPPPIADEQHDETP